MREQFLCQSRCGLTCWSWWGLWGGGDQWLTFCHLCEKVITFSHEEVIGGGAGESIQHFAVHAERWSHLCVKRQFCLCWSQGGVGINNWHGEDQYSAFHCQHKLSIVGQRSWWGGGGGLTTMQPHYLHAKHEVAISEKKTKYMDSKWSPIQGICQAHSCLTSVIWSPSLPSLLADVCAVLLLRHSSWGSYYPFVKKVKVHCSPILVMANICTIQVWLKSEGSEGERWDYWI